MEDFVSSPRDAFSQKAPLVFLLLQLLLFDVRTCFSLIQFANTIFKARWIPNAAGHCLLVLQLAKLMKSDVLAVTIGLSAWLIDVAYVRYQPSIFAVDNTWGYILLWAISAGLSYGSVVAGASYFNLRGLRPVVIVSLVAVLLRMALLCVVAIAGEFADAERACFSFVDGVAFGFFAAEVYALPASHVQRAVSWVLFVIGCSLYSGIVI